MMKRAIYVSLTAALLMAVPAGAALSMALTELPDGYESQWAGKSSFAVNLGGGKYTYGRLEFAVYDTLTASDLGMAVPGDRRYLYAYQLFNTDGNAAMTYFALTGIHSGAIESNDQIGTASGPDGGIDAESYFDASKTKAIFTFEDGLLVVGEKSTFLLLGSDAKPKVGGYEIVPSSDDNVWVPGDNTQESSIPEPATVALLLTGAALSLRKRQ